LKLWLINFIYLLSNNSNEDGLHLRHYSEQDRDELTDGQTVEELIRRIDATVATDVTSLMYSIVVNCIVL